MSSPTTSHSFERRALSAAAVAGVALVWLALPELAEAALKNAAGGGDGGGGFATLTRYLDRLATFLIPVGLAAGALGLIAGAFQLMAGNPSAGRTFGYVAVGVVMIIGSKGLVA